MKEFSESPNRHMEQLTLSEQMVNAIPLGCYLLDKESRFICLNAEMEATLKKAKSELIGKQIKEVFADSISDVYYETLNDALSLQRVFNCNYYSPITKEWQVLTASPLGEGVLVSFKRIDPPGENGTIFQQETQQLNEVQAIAKLGDYRFDIATNQVTWSNQTYAIMEMEIGESLNFEKAISVYKPSDAKRLTELTKEALTHGTSFEMDAIILVGPNKTEKYIFIQASPVYGAKGEISGIAGIVQDISTIKRAEQKILEDAAMIKGIADAAPDMLYVIDFTQMRMVYANNNVLTLFGMTLKQLFDLGPSLFDVVVYPPDRPSFDLHMAALLVAKEGEVKELTFRLVDAKGRPRWVRTRRTIFRRDNSGTPTHAVSISQDISEQIHLQEQNHQLELQKREIEELLQKRIFQVTLDTQEEERKRIAESIHNELGQLLYGVKLSLARLRLNEHILTNGDCLGVLEHTGKLLAEAIRESRKISHELTPTILEAFGLIAAIEDVGSRFSDIIPFKVAFWGMEKRLENRQEIAVYRIVQELMLNTVKHAKASLGRVELKRTLREICIKVSDNGIGFSENDINKHGTGLTNIKNKISLLKGKISIFSQPGQENLVMVTLPLL